MKHRHCLGFIAALTVLCACDASDRSDKSTRAAQELTPSSSALTQMFDSDQDAVIAGTYPNPALPNDAAAFRAQPDQRFERWQLSAMIRDPDSGHWRWVQQEISRVAVAPNEPIHSQSDWAFRDVMVQQFNHYDFATSTQTVDTSAQRRALGLADVDQNAIELNPVQLTFSGEGCAFTASLNRLETNITWRTGQCPDKFKFDNTVLVHALASVPEGVGWVSHAYGQLPSGRGAVIIESLTLVLATQDELRINRSRRFSGEGPVTIDANLHSKGEVQPLKGVTWSDTAAASDRFPSAITIQAPSIDVHLVVEVPAAIDPGMNNAFEFGATHGVLAVPVNAAGASTPNVTPGMITLFPANHADS